MSYRPTKRFLHSAQTITDFNSRFENAPLALCSIDESSDEMEEMIIGDRGELQDFFTEWGGTLPMFERLLTGERVTVLWFKVAKTRKDTVDRKAVERRFSHWWIERRI